MQTQEGDIGYEEGTERRDEMKNSAGSARRKLESSNYSTQGSRQVQCASTLVTNYLNSQFYAYFTDGRSVHVHFYTLSTVAVEVCLLPS